MGETGLGQTRQTTSEYGILGVRGVDFRLDRVPASADLAELVERHWLVSWDLPPGRQAEVTLLPHPCVNLVFDAGRLTVSGVGRERFTYRYAGRGQVYGMKFRPGAFLPFLPPSAHRAGMWHLTDQVRPAAAVWGATATATLVEDLSRAGDDLPALVAVAERHLRAHWPALDPEVARVGEIVHALLYDRTITRVDDVTDRFALSARSLQRLFRRYVGVSPKWVLRRYRLHEAAARLAEGTERSWAEVAFELGYFDQSHFIRDFARAVGMTPAAYAEACQRRQAPVSA